MTRDKPEAKPTLGFDKSKRRTLLRLLRGTAFVAPVVASFSMDGLLISEVRAKNSEHPNSTGAMHPNSTQKHKKKHKKKHKHDHDDDDDQDGTPVMHPNSM
ncbi:MAG: hypothetical protein ACXV2A_07060 [Halobacteriota archaeon]